MSFRLVPQLVTLNDLERRNSRYIELFNLVNIRSNTSPLRLSVVEFMHVLHESIVFCSTCTMSS